MLPIIIIFSVRYLIRGVFPMEKQMTRIKIDTEEFY